MQIVTSVNISCCHSSDFQPWQALSLCCLSFAFTFPVNRHYICYCSATMLCVPGMWEECCWWPNDPCISVIASKSQFKLNSQLKLEIAAQWMGVCRTCESPVAFCTGVSCHTGNSVLSEKGLVLEQGWTPAISSLALASLVPEGRV